MLRYELLTVLLPVGVVSKDIVIGALGDGSIPGPIKLDAESPNARHRRYASVLSRR